MIAVVDTSVLVGLVTLDEAELDEALVERLLDVTVHVPDVIDVDFHHALRGLLIGKKISAERAEHARNLFTDTPKVRLPTQPLADCIWSLRNNLGAYDACFIALAEALDAPLITADARQATAGGTRPGWSATDRTTAFMATNSSGAGPVDTCSALTRHLMGAR